MRTINSRITVSAVTGISGGIYLAVMYMQPTVLGNIGLSDLVMRLSGSRAPGFPLTPVISELLSLTLVLVPCYVFQIYMGIEVYRSFCTASIYVFSRTPGRIRWYLGEITGLAGTALLFQVILVVTAAVTAALMYPFYIDKAGVILAVYHIILYTLWLFSMSLIINLLAVYLGSNAAFFLVCGAQLIFTSLLIFINMFEENRPFVTRFLNLNPMAHLVIGWHSSVFPLPDKTIQGPYEGLYFAVSFLVTAGTALAAAVAGAFIVKHHDFLTADSEGGV